MIASDGTPGGATTSLQGTAVTTCEVQGAGFTEETAAPAADGQESALKSNWIPTHPFLLFTAVTMFRAYYMKHDGGFQIYRGAEDEGDP